jgi:hypothetical protein
MLAGKQSAAMQQIQIDTNYLQPAVSETVGQRLRDCFAV